MAPRNPWPDDEKLRELILYIARLSEGDRFFGVTKLNKYLFYIDFLAYRSFGNAVTGQEYQALPQGPAPRRLLPVMQRMQDSGELAVREEPMYRYTQKRPIALREANIMLFSAQEVNFIRDVIDYFRPMTASQISEASHRFIGWHLANENETIPYSVALLGRDNLTDDELERARPAERRAEAWHTSRAS
jgi:hypothetical protein